MTMTKNLETIGRERRPMRDAKFVGSRPSVEPQEIARKAFIETAKKIDLIFARKPVPKPNSN